MRDRSSTVIDPRGPNTHNTLRRIWIHTCIQEKEEEEQCHSLVVPSVLRPLPPRDGGWNDDGWTDRFSPNIRGEKKKRKKKKNRDDSSRTLLPHLLTHHLTQFFGDLYGSPSPRIPRPPTRKRTLFILKGADSRPSHRFSFCVLSVLSPSRLRLIQREEKKKKR